MTRRRGGEPTRSAPPRRIALVVVGAVIAVLIVATVLLTMGGGESIGAIETAEVAVTGNALPTYDPAYLDASLDPAVGLPAPALSGVDFDESAVSFATDGRARMIVFLAHWCPHCQAEVPRVTEWLGGRTLPPSVDLISVSTSVSPGQPNFPPSSWLRREGWPLPVIADDGSAAQAYGLASFPYWVFVDAEGLVVQRIGGELTTDTLDRAVAILAATAG